MEIVQHITDDLLERCAMRALPESDVIPLEEHLMICPDCRERLQAEIEFVTAKLEASAGHDPWVRYELANFYVSWSTTLLTQFCPDPVKNIIRRQRYKELADMAITLLDDIHERSYEWYHLMAQALYNRWDYDRALRQIEMAILELPPHSHLASGYLYFKGEIVKKRARFAAH